MIAAGAAGAAAPKAQISIRNASQSRSRSSIGASPQRKLRPVARVRLTIRSRTASLRANAPGLCSNPASHIARPHVLRAIPGYSYALAGSRAAVLRFEDDAAMRRSRPFLLQQTPALTNAGLTPRAPAFPAPVAKNTTDESALALAGADFPSCGALRVVRWINRGAWWTESGSSWALA
jgi:hypothetical protein